ncbi:MAG: tetratricopeptide repeat protein, partial [Saprospiraceae bacterium]|nr:tetratricopeptide repeat protein [Saprospiraceae bacterium]
MKARISILLLFIAVIASAQDAHKFLRDGDKWYEREKHNLAEEAYRRALDADHSLKGNYNLGNAVYRQERFEEAIEKYRNALGRDPNPGERAMIYHNLGNSYFQAGQLQESIEAFKEALKNRPGDRDTQHNLGLALQMLQQQQ